MPLLRLEVSLPVPAAKKDALLRGCSKTIAEVTGKSEGVVMVTLTECSAIFSGDPAPCAFADLRAIGGLDKKTNGQLAGALSRLLEEHAGIPVNRVFLNFTDFAPTHWGAKGGTVG